MRGVGPPSVWRTRGPALRALGLLGRTSRARRRGWANTTSRARTHRRHRPDQGDGGRAIQKLQMTTTMIPAMTRIPPSVSPPYRRSGAATLSSCLENGSETIGVCHPGGAPESPGSAPRDRASHRELALQVDPVRLSSAPRAPTRVGGLRAFGRDSGRRASSTSVLLSSGRVRVAAPGRSARRPDPDEADDGDRTRDPQLGKLMLYQLSYVRAECDSSHVLKSDFRAFAARRHARRMRRPAVVLGVFLVCCAAACTPAAAGRAALALLPRRQPARRRLPPAAPEREEPLRGRGRDGQQGQVSSPTTATCTSTCASIPATRAALGRQRPRRRQPRGRGDPVRPRARRGPRRRARGSRSSARGSRTTSTAGTRSIPPGGSARAGSSRPTAAELRAVSSCCRPTRRDTR